MSKTPYFKFFPSDFIGGTFTLDHEQVGAYMRLLCQEWMTGPLDDKTIRKVLGKNSAQLWEELVEKFRKLDDGRYVNDRLEDERNKAEKYAESRRGNGSKGGRPPKQETISKAYGFEKETETPTTDADAMLSISKSIQAYGYGYEKEIGGLGEKEKTPDSYVTLEELQAEIERSAAWKDELRMYIDTHCRVLMTERQLSDKLAEFIGTLRLSNVEGKVLDEGRKHFLNWLRKNPNPLVPVKGDDSDLPPHRRRYQERKAGQ